MSHRSTLGAVIAAILLAGLPNEPAAFARGGKNKLGNNNELAVFLGCGGVRGPGTVVQVDASGKVLGTVNLANTPYGLAALKDGLVAALPTSGKVVKIDAEGKKETLFSRSARLGRPTCDRRDSEIR